jgi:hypothetical protein
MSPAFFHIELASGKIPQGAARKRTNIPNFLANNFDRFARRNSGRRLRRGVGVAAACMRLHLFGPLTGSVAPSIFFCCRHSVYGQRSSA